MVERILAKLSNKKKEESCSPVQERSILALATYKTLMPDDYSHIRSRSSKVFSEKEDTSKPTHYSPCIQSLIDNNWLTLNCLHYIGLDASEISHYLERIIFDNDTEYEKTAELISTYYTMWRVVLLKNNQMLAKVLDKYAWLIFKSELDYGMPNIEIISNAPLIRASDKYNEGKNKKDIFDSKYFSSKLADSTSGVREKLTSIVKYMLKFQCAEWSWLQILENDLDGLVACINLEDGEISQLLAIQSAKENIQSILNGLQPQAFSQFHDKCLTQAPNFITISKDTLSLRTDIINAFNQRT